MPNYDMIYQAYIGKLGKTFEEYTRNRINWIVEQAKECQEILDVGCSQGITSLLLGEQHKQVIGLDIQQENIDFANSLLEEKYEKIRSSVKFLCIDFLDYNTSKTFDCIIMSEVLEHLMEPDRFLEKAVGLLRPDGKLIITVPFGVNNHPDHHSTFYMAGIYSLVDKFFNVNGLLFQGRWIGLIASQKYSGHQIFKLDIDAITKQELNFLEIDKNSTQRIEILSRHLENANKKYKEALDNYEIAKQWTGNIKNKNEKLQSSYTELRSMYEATAKTNNEINKKYKSQIIKYIQLETEYGELKKSFSDLKYRNDKLEKICEELNQQIRKANDAGSQYAKTLIDYINGDGEGLQLLYKLKTYITKLETQNDYLRRENEEYRRKIAKITNTKLGRIGIKIYHLLKKIKFL